MAADNTQEDEYIPDEVDPALLREMNDRQKLCDTVALTAVRAGTALLLSADESGKAKCADIAFVRGLYLTLLGSLNAHDIPLTRKNIETAFEVCLDEHAAAALLDPHQAGTDRMRFKTPAIETFITRTDEHDDDRTKIFMARIRDKLQARERIKNAVAEGALHIVENTPDDTPEAIIDKVRDHFTNCLRQQLEAGHPGITSDKSNPIWKDPLTLVHTLGRVNMQKAVGDALQYSVAFISDEDFDKALGKHPAAPPAP